MLTVTIVSTSINRADSKQCCGGEVGPLTESSMHSLTACARCGQPVQRMRTTAIYCSALCREKTNTRRATVRRRKSRRQKPIYGVA
jgi:hypothetical protein